MLFQSSTTFEKKGQHLDDATRAEMKLVTTGRVPGYTGFVRGSQHIAGHTYGSTTRAAQKSYSGPFKKIEVEVELPTSPHQKSRGENYRAPSHQIPGYCGYLTGERDHFGQTYGSITKSTGRRWGNSRVYDPAATFDDSASLSMSDLHSFTMTTADPTIGYLDGPPSNNKESQPPGQREIQPTPKAYKGANIKEKLKVRRQKKEGLVPGYCGFVRNSQHIQGFTFGNATRSLAVPKRQEAWGGKSSMLPLEPHRTKAPKNRRPNPALSGKTYQVPGYTGFLAGQREKYSDTYGSTTAKLAPQQPNGWFKRDYMNPGS